MKGYIYNGPGNISFQDIPLSPCGDNDIIIRNLAAGICGSKVNAYQHDGDSVYIFKGLEFGHEMVSEVVEVGTKVEGLSVGDRVYPFPIHCKDDPMHPATMGASPCTFTSPTAGSIGVHLRWMTLSPTMLQL